MFMMMMMIDGQRSDSNVRSSLLVVHCMLYIQYLVNVFRIHATKDKTYSNLRPAALARLWVEE